MRAQISVETLLVFTIFILLVGIAYFATTKIGAGAQERVEAVLSRNSFNSMASKAEEACQLGNGNVRIAEIEGSLATIFSTGKGFLFTTKEFSGNVSFSCRVEIAQAQPAKSFTISNDQGVIKIS